MAAPITRAVGAAALALTLVVTPLTAQGARAGDGVRFSVFAGGISPVGFAIEFFRNTHALEIGVGTWSFDELAISTVYKKYIGGDTARPFAGAGIWVTTVSPPEARRGYAVGLRVPVGMDWSFIENHSIGTALNLNRGLWIRRSNSEDDSPLNGRIVPLPEVYYRYPP